MRSFEPTGHVPTHQKGPGNLFRRAAGVALSSLALIMAAGLLGLLANSKLAAEVPQVSPDPASMARQWDGPADWWTAPEACDGLDGLEAFFDGSIGTLFEVHNIPGGVVTIVCGGETAFTKGYGFADAARRRPVDPARTLFRPGSISKTVTWTAVMQLVEQGKLDLDTDVNEYLTQLSIPDTYAQPVTLRHLLSHTAGFEDGAIGYLFRRNADDLLSPAVALKRTMPARVRPPGQLAAYSNWGTSLAGLIVAEVTGTSFDDYVAREIFAPLGMTNSTFSEPAAGLADAYPSENLERTGGTFRDGGFEFIHDFGPAGSLSSTGEDMARFMIAHLTDGQGILRPKTVRRMRQPLFEHHDALPAMLHGFYEERHNGLFVYSHGGDTVYFHSTMTLVPKAGVGIFISFNAPEGAYAARQILPAFFDRYFPAQADFPLPDDPGDDALPVAKLQEYVGAYRNTRRAYSNWEKALSLGGDVTVEMADGGALLISSFYLKDALRLIPAGEDVFRSIDEADDLVAFRRNKAGEVSHLFVSAVPFLSYERLGTFDSSATVLQVAGFSLLIFSGTVVAAIVGWRRWLRMRREEVVASALAVLASLLNLVFAAVGMLMITALGEEIIFTGIPNLKMLLTIPVIALAAALIAGALVPVAWIRSYWDSLARLRYTLVVAILLIFAAGLYRWNLLGPWFA
ncbi:beta-lactamase family protein [Pacificimonas sp. WHA3]|uniref:Beta-lactamase family protein n=1 Tax=Pacificimonas pallii TaxID=2827236 RepID=A0ABS6SA84_9SPHN|nr:serine hydrolase domain-containing protein [Pacificimonas pallii]MBV7255305.1 beta-lactamase family protein [Pacificimonas pallii]